MSAIRVALYAEGSYELGQQWPYRQPGHELDADELGPAHVLVRRAICRVRSVPENAVRFDAPLRKGRAGAFYRGSDLIVAENLARIRLGHQVQPHRPSLVVVLVDEDGMSDREAAVTNAAGPMVVGVAVREFEAWLIADQSNLARQAQVSDPGPPEQLAPGEAKRIVQQAGDAPLRRTLAATSDLEQIERRCPSFARFVQRLAPTGGPTS